MLVPANEGLLRPFFDDFNYHMSRLTDVLIMSNQPCAKSYFLYLNFSLHIFSIPRENRYVTTNKFHFHKLYKTLDIRCYLDQHFYDLGTKCSVHSLPA